MNEKTIEGVVVREIPGYPQYFVSIDGRVWSEKQRGRWVEPYMNHGYARVYLWSKLKRNGFTLSRLVMLAWGSAQPSKQDSVWHKNSDCSDNRLSNLVWARSYQAAMKIKHWCPAAKLTEEQVRLIRHLHKEEHASMASLAESFEVGQPTISNIIHRRTWKDVK